MLTRHLAYWLDVLEALLPDRQPQIELSVFDNPVLAERLADTIRPALADKADLLIDKPDRTQGAGTTPASPCGSRPTTAKPNSVTGPHHLDRPAEADAKERCLVSCIATERLAALVGRQPDHIMRASGDELGRGIRRPLRSGRYAE